jgi:hypothetical protein
MHAKLFDIHHHIVSICRSMALIFVTLFCSLLQPSYISDAVRLQMRLNKHWQYCLEYEMILIDGTVYQGTYCITFILNLFSHEFQTISALYWTVRTHHYIIYIYIQSLWVIQKDSIFSDQLWLSLQVTLEMFKKIILFSM